MGERHQGQEGVAAVIAKGDISSDSGKRHQQRDQSTAQQLTAQAGADRVDGLTTRHKRTGHRFNGSYHGLSLSGTEGGKPQQQRLATIKQLHPWRPDVGHWLVVLGDELQRLDLIRNCRSLELVAGVIATALQLNLRAPGEIKAGAQRQAQFGIQPAADQPRQGQQNSQS